MSLRSNRIAAVALGATILVGFGSFGAVAAGLIDSSDIKNGSIQSVDVRNDSLQSVDIKNGQVTKADVAESAVGSNEVLDGSLQVRDLSDDAQKALKGKTGIPNLIAGAGYTNTWTGDNGATLQTALGQCPAGQYALGGGFSTWGGDKDLGGDNKNIQITVSAPYFEGDYVPVDKAGNFRPTEWVVKGYNNGDTDQIVRAWVTCADIAK